MTKGYMCIRRYPGQRILIEGDIEIRIGSSKGQQVQVLVYAPGKKITRISKEEDAADRKEARERYR